MPHLICYDITKNSLRAKLGRTILDYGLDRINKSVYLGTIKEVALKELEGKLAAWMKEKGEPNDSAWVSDSKYAGIWKERFGQGGAKRR